MPSFTVNVHRFDPYKGFKFRVRWDGRFVPDVHRVTGLRWTPPRPWPAPGPVPGARAVVGGVLERVRARHSTPAPAAATQPAVGGHWTRLVIERGRTHDTAFEQWATEAAVAARTGQGGASVRKDVVIEVANEAGQTALAFKVFGCVPVEYMPIGDLDANRSDVLLERLALEYDRAERDREVVEPAEPSFDEPPR